MRLLGNLGPLENLFLGYLFAYAADTAANVIQFYVYGHSVSFQTLIAAGLMISVYKKNKDHNNGPK